MRPSPYEGPYKLARPVGGYALAASRYAAQYGLKKEQLGAVALAARQWAQKNPDAFMREPLTMDEYLASRMVCDPFSVRDRSEEHTSELQSLMRSSYAVFCLKTQRTHV